MINTIINDIIKSMVKQEDDLLKKYLILNALPKIKEPITKGKLKHRGIKLVIKNDGFRTIKWIEQRGVIISPKIEFGNESTCNL